MIKNIILFLILMTFITALNGSAFAKEKNETENETHRNFNNLIQREFNKGPEDGKNKFFFRNNKNSNKVKIKGIINATSSGTLTINNFPINIDSNITGNLKIVGNIQPGMYAIVSGIILDSKYYAEKIIVNQRNKNELEEINEVEVEHINSTSSAIATTSGLFEQVNSKNDLNSVVLKLTDLLNFLKDWLSKI